THSGPPGHKTIMKTTSLALLASIRVSVTAQRIGPIALAGGLLAALATGCIDSGHQLGTPREGTGGAEVDEGTGGSIMGAGGSIIGTGGSIMGAGGSIM